MPFVFAVATLFFPEIPNISVDAITARRTDTNSPSVEILFGQITTFCGARSNPYLAHSVLADARDFLAIEAIPAVRAKYLFPTHALDVQRFNDGAHTSDK